MQPFLGQAVPMKVREPVPVQVLPQVLLFLWKGIQRVLEQVVSRGRGILRRAVLLRVPARQVRSLSGRVGQKAARLEGLMVAQTVVCLVDLWAEKRVFRLFPRSRSRSLRWPHPRSWFLPFVPPRPGVQGPRCRQKHRQACSQVGSSLPPLGLFQQKFSVWPR